MHKNTSKEKKIPLVSVVIPTHERANFIHRSVLSVQKQTLTDLEIVVVDDNSADNTEEVVCSMGDPRIRYIRNASNLGGSGSRNVGIEASRGRYVAFLDDDDEWLPEKLQEQVTLLNEYPSLSMTYTGYQFLDNDTGKIYRTVIPEPSRDIRNEILKTNCIGTTSTAMITRQCLLSVGGFDPDLRGCQDWDLWIRIADRHQIAPVTKSLVKFYDHANRISQNLSLKVEAKKRLYEKHKDDICKSRISKSYHLFKIGQLICHNGSVGEGRGYLWRAIGTYPMSRLYYKYLFYSFLGNKYYAYALQFKRKFASKSGEAIHP